MLISLMIPINRKLIKIKISFFIYNFARQYFFFAECAQSKFMKLNEIARRRNLHHTSACFQHSLSNQIHSITESDRPYSISTTFALHSRRPLLLVILESTSRACLLYSIWRKILWTRWKMIAGYQMTCKKN